MQEVPRGQTTQISVPLYDFALVPFNDDDWHFYATPPEWGTAYVSGNYPDATLTITVTIPSDALIGATGSVVYFHDYLDGTNRYSCAYYQQLKIIEGPCTCKAVVTAFPKLQTGSDYNLELTLAPGDCAGPLSNIVWTPSPNSGQGSDKATYNGLKRGTVYEISVSATDGEDCETDVSLSFQLPPLGVCNPSCGG
jgi:hypothetical protein